MCEARREGDQMSCGRCGLAWDINDPEPPECLTEEQMRHQRAEQARDKAKREIKELLK